MVHWGADRQIASTRAERHKIYNFFCLELTKSNALALWQGRGCQGSMDTIRGTKTHIITVI